MFLWLTDTLKNAKLVGMASKENGEELAAQSPEIVNFSADAQISPAFNLPAINSIAEPSQNKNGSGSAHMGAEHWRRTVTDHYRTNLRRRR